MKSQKNDMYVQMVVKNIIIEEKSRSEFFEWLHF